MFSIASLAAVKPPDRKAPSTSTRPLKASAMPCPSSDQLIFSMASFPALNPPERKVPAVSSPTCSVPRMVLPTSGQLICSMALLPRSNNPDKKLPDVSSAPVTPARIVLPMLPQSIASAPSFPLPKSPDSHAPMSPIPLMMAAPTSPQLNPVTACRPSENSLPKLSLSAFKPSSSAVSTSPPSLPQSTFVSPSQIAPTISGSLASSFGMPESSPDASEATS